MKYVAPRIAGANDEFLVIAASLRYREKAGKLFGRRARCYEPSVAVTHSQNSAVAS